MLWNGKKNEKVLYKDNEFINQRSRYLDNCKELANIIRKARKENNYSKYFLDESKISKRKYNPNHEKCDMNAQKTSRLTEKRICRCMNYFNQNNDKCANCPIKKKYKNISNRFFIEDYEVPMEFITEKCGGIDLLIKDRKNNKVYAVEVKPKDSSETLVRMIAEIFTYTTDCSQNYKRAIAFFKGSRQEKDYFKEEYIQNDDFNYLLNQVTVFRITEKENKDSNIIEYDIELLDRNNVNTK